MSLKPSIKVSIVLARPVPAEKEFFIRDSKLCADRNTYPFKFETFCAVFGELFPALAELREIAIKMVFPTNHEWLTESANVTESLLVFQGAHPSEGYGLEPGTSTVFARYGSKQMRDVTEMARILWLIIDKYGEHIETIGLRLAPISDHVLA